MSLGLILWPQGWWTSSTGTPARPAIQRSPHAVIVAIEWIEVKSFLREPILESTAMLFIRDTAKNSVAYQLTQPVRQAMRREL